MGIFDPKNPRPNQLSPQNDDKYEGGSSNVNLRQVTVEANNNLDLQQMGSIDSNSFSEDSSEQSNREAEEAGTPKKNRKGKNKTLCETSIFTNTFYVIF